MSHIFVATLSKEMIEPLRKGLVEQDFTLSTPPYTHFLAKKKGLSVTLYQSLKLTVQGKEMAQFIEYFLEPQILKTFAFSHPTAGYDPTPRIGVDEAGKGDFFGSLCIASLFAEGKGVERLLTLGVKDSKELSDKKILTLGHEIQKEFQHEIIRIKPKRYNELYASFSNLNSLLAWGHATAIEKLVARSGCSQVIIDKFAHEHVVENAAKRKNLSIQLIQRVKAEEDVVVAAASILARTAFLEEMAALSQLCGMELPKGASSKVIEAGKALAAKFGREFLLNVAKTHFRTMELL